MKATVKINVSAEEITMTKATAAKASFVGTKEYEHLAQAKKDFPNFRVKILSPKTTANNNKGLTLAVMDSLVKAITNGNQEASNAFEAVKECYKGSSFHFSKPKAYFLSQYPNWREWLPEVEERQAETDIEAPPPEITIERQGIFHRKSV
jgi:hypothetical protein